MSTTISVLDVILIFSLPFPPRLFFFICVCVCVFFFSILFAHLPYLRVLCVPTARGGLFAGAHIRARLLQRRPLSGGKAELSQAIACLDRGWRFIVIIVVVVSARS
jgi:hypothetical protein